MSRPKLYAELASWWPLLSAPSEYADEAVYYRLLLTAAGDPPASTLLELGSGGGNTASHLKAHFTLTLVDLSPAMLNVSRALNPECVHIEGDMRSVRLKRTFDRVFVHDAIMYMTTEQDLRQALDTCYVHCRPGGAVLLVPDCVRETFVPATQHGGRDADGRGLRYLEWSADPDPRDTTYTVDLVYALRERDGSVRVEHDRHVYGLFTGNDWLRLIRAAGFRPQVVPDSSRGLIFLGTRPAL